MLKPVDDAINTKRKMRTVLINAISTFIFIYMT
jgi:hypothetical protein